jgi:hypothetical protein
MVNATGGGARNVRGRAETYGRGDALEKRRKLMDAWAAYCESKAPGNVVQIRKARA